VRSRPATKNLKLAQLYIYIYTPTWLTCLRCVLVLPSDSPIRILSVFFLHSSCSSPLVTARVKPAREHCRLRSPRSCPLVSHCRPARSRRLTVTIHCDSRLPPLACLIRGSDLKQCLLTAPRTIVRLVVNADPRCPLALDPQEHRDWDPAAAGTDVSQWVPSSRLCTGQIQPLCTCLFVALRAEKKNDVGSKWKDIMFPVNK